MEKIREVRKILLRRKEEVKTGRREELRNESEDRKIYKYIKLNISRQKREY
jgi:hypothetical protein